MEVGISPVCMNENVGIQSDHDSKEGFLWASMASLIAAFEMLSAEVLLFPAAASLSLNGSTSSFKVCSKAEMTSDRKVSFRSAIQCFARFISESGRSMVVLIHKNIS